MKAATNSGTSRRAVLIAAVLGSSLVFLDGTTVNVALPALQETLGASVTDVQWVVNSYTLFLAALLMLGGSLGDHLGRKRVFIAGMVVFTLSSVWSGLAGGVEQLIIARAFQGVGGALLTPGSLALINAHFSESERGAAIGSWSSFSAIATAFGPVIGGWLIDALSWRWIFFMNVPLAAVALIITVRGVPESREIAPGARLDFTGAVLVTAGLGGAVFGLLEGPARGWSDPLVLGAALGGLLLLYANLAGLGFFLPLFLIQVRGFSAAAAGAATMPLVILLVVASGWSGRLYDRVGPRLPIAGGAFITAMAFVLFIVLKDAAAFWVAVTIPMTVMGAGMALLVAPLTTTVMAAVPDALAGTASGVNNAISRVAGLLAIGLLGAVMFATFSARLSDSLAATDIAPETRSELLASANDLAGMRLPEAMPDDAATEARTAIHESFTAGYSRILAAMAVVAALGGVLALVTLPGRDSAVGG